MKNLRNKDDFFSGDEETVKSVRFAAFEGVSGQAESQQSMDILVDVPLQVVAELGRTKLPVKDILKLGVGAVIELDKIADDPIDLRVNDKLIAKGEVVAIDDYFGVRITEIATG
jgi:flagellar motor switch protein FliN